MLLTYDLKRRKKNKHSRTHRERKSERDVHLYVGECVRQKHLFITPFVSVASKYAPLSDSLNDVCCFFFFLVLFGEVNEIQFIRQIDNFSYRE